MIKKILKITILAILFIIGLSIVCNYHVDAYKNTGNGIEVFNEDYQRYGNFFAVPVNMLSNVSLWCMEHKYPNIEYMTASEKFYDAYVNNAYTNSEFDGIRKGVDVYNNPRWYVNGNLYRYYGKSKNMGLLLRDDESYGKYINWKQNLDKNYPGNTIDREYKADTTFWIKLISSNPGQYGIRNILDVPFYSTEFSAGDILASSDNQDALYVLTSFPVYADGDVYANNPDLELDVQQKQRGYFTTYEKQYALWECGINIGEKVTSDEENNDRGLGNIAKSYRNFYNSIHNGEYSDFIQVSDSEKTETLTRLDDGLSYTTYKVNNNKTNKGDKIILGPYCIDYTVDDINYDCAYTTEGYQVKFNAIENITIYNQNKQDIKDFEAQFYIAYTPDGTKPLENYTRINDDWYENGDGAAIEGFNSKKSFYIVINKGTMKDSDFTGFYVKIDFQYLEEITGTLQEYKGVAWRYEYKKTNPTMTFTASLGDLTIDTLSIPTHLITLNKTKITNINKPPQTLLAYGNDGQRVYNTYSIVLTSELNTEIESGIEITKINKSTGEPIKDVQFKVVVGSIDTFNPGVNNYNTYNTNTYWTGLNEETGYVTDKNGKIYISLQNVIQRNKYIGILLLETKIQSYKDLRRFIVLHFDDAGNVDNKFIYNVYNYSGRNQEWWMSLGRLNEDDLSNLSVDKGIIKIILKNEKNEKTRKIQILKQDENDNTPLKGAKFSISYGLNTGSFQSLGIFTTDSNGLIEIAYSKIEKLMISERFTGTINLKIKETRPPDGYDLSENVCQLTIKMEQGNITSVSSDTNPTEFDNDLPNFDFYYNSPYYGPYYAYLYSNQIARIIVQNTKTAKITNLPKIQIRKLNQNESRLGGVSLSVNINKVDDGRKYYSNYFSTSYFEDISTTIGFSDVFKTLLDYNTSSKTIGNKPNEKIIDELNEINSVKLFQKEYACGKDGQGLTLQDVNTYIREEVKRNMMNAMKATTKYKEWNEGRINNEDGYNTWEYYNKLANNAYAWCERWYKSAELNSEGEFLGTEDPYPDICTLGQESQCPIEDPGPAPTEPSPPSGMPTLDVSQPTVSQEENPTAWEDYSSALETYGEKLREYQDSEAYKNYLEALDKWAHETYPAWLIKVDNYKLHKAWEYYRMYLHYAEERDHKDRVRQHNDYMYYNNKIEAAEKDVASFAAENPNTNNTKGTEDLIKWLTDKQIDKDNKIIKNYNFGKKYDNTTYGFGTPPSYLSNDDAYSYYRTRWAAF